MQTPHDQHSHLPAGLTRRWHRVRAIYRFVNKVTHHTLGAVVKTVALVYFLFCVAYLILRIAIMPNIDVYKSDIERLAGQSLGQRVGIARIAASWEGVRPRLTLQQVVVFDRDNRPALTLPEVSATLSWWSVPLMRVQLNALEVRGADLDVARDSQGRIFVAGILVERNHEDDGSGLDWLLSQHQIAIRDGHIRWTDQLRDAPALDLQHVDIAVRNHWQHHQLGMRVVPPASLAGPLDVRVDFTNPPFGAAPSDLEHWKGQLYLKVAATEFTAWKTYLDYPVEVNHGTGAAQVWLAFDQGHVRDVTADLALENAHLRLAKDLPPLALDQFNGRIGFRETDDNSGVWWRSGKVPGHALELSNLNVRTVDGLSLTGASVSETYVASDASGLPRTEVKVKGLDLQTLSALAERLPLTPDKRKILEDFAPQGRLPDMDVVWQGNYPDVASYQVRGSFESLGLKAQAAHPGRPRQGRLPARAPTPPIPGFEHLSGTIDASERGGSVKLDTPGLKLRMDGYFTDADLIFDKLQLDASWSLKAGDKAEIDVQRMAFAFEGIDANVSGRHVLPLTSAGGPGYLDLQGHIERLDLARVGRYLPVQTPEHLRNWLTGALKGGSLEDVSLRVKGDLADFPYRLTSPGDKPKGDFFVQGKLVDASLEYTPDRKGKDGRSPLWPLAEKIQGKITFDRTRMDVHADTAVTHGVALKDVSAIIPDLAMHDSPLLIEGVAEGALSELLAYTVDSPVVDMISQFTEKTRGTGKARLNLKLDIPVNHSIDTRVTGQLQFLGNELQLMPDVPPLVGTNGKLEFSERGFALTNMKANMLGGPVTITGGMRDNVVLVKADGTLTADGLRKTYAGTGVSGLLKRISGAARYTINVGVKKRRLDVDVDTALQGIALDLPAPLRKSAIDNLPLHVNLNASTVSEGPVSHDDIRIGIGSVVNAHYEREKTNTRNAVWHVVRGGIGINTPAPQPDSGVTLSVNLRTLDIDAWRTVVDGIDDRPHVAGASADDASMGALAELFDPSVMALRANQAVLFGKTWDRVSAGISHDRSAWQANIDSQQVSGHVAWNDSSAGSAQYKVVARLSSLQIPKDATVDVGQILEGKSTTTELPALDVVADEFELKGRKLGKLELLANNAQTIQGREWRINRLALSNPDSDLRATGSWLTRSGENLTSLNYEFDIRDAGKMLERFGFAGIVRAGHGSLKGDIGWHGLPFDMDLATLQGKLALDLQRGQFLKTDNAAGAKLLGILSLQSIPRRLTFDFRDLFSEGFAFDGVTVSGTINHGVLRTDNLKMRGLAATVLMDGSADIAHETTSLHLVIIPEANAGAASVVYGLAVNPVIGLGSFLAQLFLREPLMKALTSEYTVSGPWSDPVVTKMNHNTSDARQTQDADKRKREDG